jgi:hypothetical protein
VFVTVNVIAQQGRVAESPSCEEILLVDVHGLPGLGMMARAMSSLSMFSQQA